MEFYSIIMTSYAVVLLLVVHSVSAKNGHRSLTKQSTKNYLENTTHDTIGETRSSLKAALPTFGTELDESLGEIFDLGKLTISNVGSTFTVDGPEDENIRVGDIIDLPKGINLNGERTWSRELEKYVLTLKNPASFDISVDQISLNVRVDDLEIKLSEDYQECYLKLRSAYWTGENINTLLNSWGFNNKESYINTAALTPEFRQSFNRQFTNYGDLFDTAQLIYIRIGTDNNLHIAFIPYEDAQYQMFVCTNLGSGNVTEKGCALVKELSNDDNRFTNWVKKYAKGVDLSQFDFKYESGSTIQTSKSIISYHDTKNTKAMEWLAFEKSNSKKYPMEINGGNDYYVVQFNVVTDVNSRDKTYSDYSGSISSNNYKNVFLTGKLYTDRLEMTFKPSLTTTTTTLTKLFKASDLKNFLRSRENVYSAEANAEKIVLKNDGSVCIDLSFDSPVALSDRFTTHNVQYELKDSVIQVCQIGRATLTVTSVKNEEEAFHSKAFINIAYLHGRRQMTFSGELMIVSSDKLFEELSVSFVPSDRVSQYQHITRFPISNLNHLYVKREPYIKFRGNAIFYNHDFEMEVTYKYSEDSAGLCLERNINRDEQTQKSSKRQEDTNEAPQTDFNVESGTRKPISFLNLTRFLVKNKDIEFTPLVKFVDAKIAFIPRPRFYSGVYDNNRCIDVMNNINIRRLRSPEPWIFIAVGQADYSCTDGLEQENDLCRFIKKAIGIENQQYSNKMFYGYLNDKLEEGLVVAKYEENNEVFTIHNGFQLRDFTQTMGYMKEPANSEELPPSLPDIGGPPFEGNQFRGKITMPGLPADDYSSFAPIYGYLQISGKFLHLSIPETGIERQPVDLLNHEYVKTKVIFADRQLIELVDDPKIVFKGTVSIGGNNDPIDIGGEGAIVEQHLYGDQKKNKLVACLPKDAEEKSLASIAEAFNIRLMQDIFNIDVTNICFTYHQENEKWNVTSANVLADKGLWLHGKTKVWGTNKKGVREEFNVDVQLRCDPSNKQVKLGRPPMYFYRIERTQAPNQDQLFDQLEDNEEAMYKVVITRRKEAKDLGPFLVINVGERGRLTATLEGYITTVAFESKITFTVSTNDYETVQFLRDPIQEAKKREENEKANKRPMLSEGFECKGNLRTKLFQFRFTGNGLIGLIKANYSLLVERAQNYFKARDEEHARMQQEITDASSGPLKKASKKEELATMYYDIQTMKSNFRNEDLKKRSSCRYCKSVKAPGFVWNSCPISDRLGKVSCLQFKKDALKSCDVQCLARCDISKVDAEESSKGMQEELFRRTAQLEKRSRTTEMYDDLRTRLSANEEAISTALTQYRDSLEDVTSIQKVLPIINIRTDWVDFSNFKKYDSLDFTLVFPPPDRQVENELIVRNIVVDGFLPVRVAEYFFNRDHVENVNRTIDLEKAVQISYGASVEIVKSWEIRNEGELMRQRRRRRPVQKKKTSKRAYDYIRVNERPTSLISTNGKSMNLLLKQHAPWNILRKSNPFAMANTSSTVNKARRSKVSKSASFCRNRRNRIRDYKDMIKYMTSWSDSFDQAKTFLQNSKTDITNGLNTLDAELLHKRTLKNSTMSKKREDISKKWINRMKSGFSTWENEFNQQLSSYHSIAPKLMWNEMNAIFTPAEFDSLQSYLRSTPSSALARSIAPDPPIQQIGMSFVNGFASMKTLDDNRNLIKQITSMVQQAEQSSQSCHDEL